MSTTFEPYRLHGVSDPVKFGTPSCLWAVLASSWQIQAARVCFHLAFFLDADALHVVPEGYHRPDVVEVVDEDFAGSGTTGTGTATDPFFFDDDDSSNPPPPTPSTPHGPSSMQSDPPHSDNPPSASKQRLKPKGILLGTWSDSELQAAVSNAVYGSRDVMNRINRRVNKVSMDGLVVLGGNFDVKKTACSHDKIDYLPEFAGMSKAEVDSHIMPLLVAQEEEESGGEETARKRRAESPLAEAASRRAAMHGSRTPVVGGHQVRGGRFFVSMGGVVHEAAGQ